jgi:hypothetical protein
MAPLHSIFFVFLIHLITLLLTIPLVFIAERSTSRNASLPMVHVAAIAFDADDLAPPCSYADQSLFSSHGEPLELIPPSNLTLPSSYAWTITVPVCSARWSRRGCGYVLN